MYADLRRICVDLRRIHVNLRTCIGIGKVAETLRAFMGICVCLCCFSSFSRFYSLPTPIHKGIHKGGRRPKVAAPRLWGRREASPPLWMGVWGLGRQQARKTWECVQNMHMHADSMCEVWSPLAPWTAHPRKDPNMIQICPNISEYGMNMTERVQT